MHVAENAPGSKSPGLVVLEHELSTQSVAAFIAAYPVIKANGWKTQSLLQLVQIGSSAYQNKADVVGSALPLTAGATSSASAANSTSTTTYVFLFAGVS